MAVTISRAWTYDNRSARYTVDALGDVFQFPARCIDAVTVDVRGTFVGTLLVEGSTDGINWTQCTATINPATGASGSTSFTAANQAQFYIGGYTTVRTRVSAFTSGSMTVSIEEAAGFEISQIVGTVTTSAAAGTTLMGDVSMQPRATTGGLSAPARLLTAAASTNPTSVKASAGRVYKIIGYNASATVKFLKLFNKASAPVTGTDTPVVTIPLPPSKEFSIDLGPFGMYLATGIAYAITGAVADLDNTALAAGDVVGMNLWYA